MLTAYARFIARHSYLFLFIITLISTTLTVVPLVCNEIPSFADPIVGFETRGTNLAHRFIAWRNLIDETRPSKLLAVNPKDIEDQIRMNDTYINRTRQDKTRSGQGHPNKHKNRNKKKKVHNTTDREKAWLNLEDNLNATGHVHWGYGKNVSYEDDNVVFQKDHNRRQWITLKDLQNEIPKHHNYASGKCGSPDSEYAHLVITTSDKSSLLSFNNVKKMCELQSVLVQNGGLAYQNLCQRPSHSDEVCCPVWSVPNYIALLSGKISCENLTEDNVNSTIATLKQCAGYFHNFTLLSSCDLDRCKVPKYCTPHDAVYNLLFYLLNADAFSPKDYSNTHVKNALMFFPLPMGSTVMPYYKTLTDSILNYKNLVIPAMDFGLKNALFDLWIIQDTWLVGMGSLFVFICVWLYTESLILTVLLLIAISYSLGIAYFVYVYVFNLLFFPFMNLLVIVVVIGIGADDAFLYVKVWKMISKQLISDNVTSDDNNVGNIKNMSSAGETILVQILEESLKHSVVAIFVTTLTTSVAFFASYVSNIPAINCFSIFAGTAVLVNFFLMVTWLPVSVYIVDVKVCRSNGKCLNNIHKHINEMWEELTAISNRFITTCVMKLHVVFIVVLGAIGIYSIVVVFYSPGLRLPDSREFQLFQISHPFEQYDINYRENFLFERLGKDLDTGYKLPLRWIWGVKAFDNGNHMDPYSKGHLVLDNKFSMSDPKSQVWLLNFCTKLKAQPFYQPMLGPLLPNCFIESFKMYMTRRCIDTIDKIDRTPCCEVSTFPYKKEVFELCLNKAIESLYQTPRALFMPGVAGPKFLRSSSPPKVVAVVVEFESVVSFSMSYTAMNNFFTKVENWTQQELKSAPPAMKSGWFISDLQWYDLQKTLASGTVMALILSAGLGFLVLIPATFSFEVSACALISIIFSSTVSIAILVINQWKLNVLESVAISTSAGLAVDFSLHYALSYTKASGLKSVRLKYCLSSATGPTAAAALTTGFSGIFLLRSNLLPYSQIGTFLALIMTVSWLYATFFLCSLLCIFGKSSKDSALEERKSVSRVSSVCSGVPNLESHELEHLADSNRTNLTHSHSPSSISATTVVLHDDCENPHIKIDTKSGNLVSDTD